MELFQIFAVVFTALLLQYLVDRVSALKRENKQLKASNEYWKEMFNDCYKQNKLYQQDPNKAP